MVIRGDGQFASEARGVMTLWRLLLLLAGACTATFAEKRALFFEDFTFKDIQGNTVSYLETDFSKLDPSTFENCKDDSDSDVELCRRWKDGTELSIRNMEYCVTSTLTKSTLIWRSCVPSNTSHWYGGGEEWEQLWPLEKYQNLEHPLVPSDEKNRAIQDPLWFSSDGRLLYVFPGSPVFISLNTKSEENQLCVEYAMRAPYRQRPEGYTASHILCQFSDAKEAYQYAMDNLVGRPSAYPDERMIRYPIWSTWAKYKKNINEDVVREFAKEIKEHGFENSQLEIDDEWETCYGSKEVDTKRFPNMKKLTDDLKKDGFRVTIWTHPFIQQDCTETLKEASEKGYLVRDTQGNTATHWWDGDGTIVDFTKKEAADWFVEKHNKLMRQHGIDGFKFDAGEVTWNPQLPALNIPSDPREVYPNLATTKYVQTCARFNNLTEVRSAYLTQSLPFFVRMIDKDSHWGENNGLKSLVTTLLQMNMVGYSFVLPDMIGGNQYGEDVATQELFIRWLQANTFMPALQYALVPWDFKDTTIDTVKIAKKFNDLHAAYADIIIKAMKKKIDDGSPVNAPIWWIDPTDERALQEDSEYLLGENVLVAPVLEKGAIKRDVYLPKGAWRDGNDISKVYMGPCLIKDFSAPLDTLPWFVISGSDADFKPPVPPTSSSTPVNPSVFVVFLLLTLCLW